jgi:hypothetical protein
LVDSVFLQKERKMARKEYRAATKYTKLNAGAVNSLVKAYEHLEKNLPEDLDGSLRLAVLIHRLSGADFATAWLKRQAELVRYQKE